MQVLFGKGVVTKYLLTILTSVSFEGCQNECASRPMCDLVLYQRSHVCELHTAIASRPENIAIVPSSIVMMDVTPSNTCDSCLGNSSSIRECRDCTDIKERGNTESAVYFVNETFYFLCTFDDTGEAWLYELRVDLGLFNGSGYFAHYSTFNLTGADVNYRLIVGGYTGTAGDSLAYHNGMQFSAYDRDNDNNSYKHGCAYFFKNGWWYNNCHRASLNGQYHHGGEKLETIGRNIHWKTLSGYSTSLKTTVMRINVACP